MVYLMLFLLAATADPMETKILKLHPEASTKTAKMVADAVKEFAPAAGFVSVEDQDLILAVIKKESSFIQPRIAGGSGEWGMMQVIPTDGHIKRIALDYRCNAEEQALPSVEVTFPNGEVARHRLCNGTNPNILSGGKVWPWKLSVLLKHSVRAGIFIGIHELKFWKKKYEDGLKERFWDTDNRVPLDKKWWHKKVKDGLGPQVWVCHYNYGSQLKTSQMAMSYPLMLMKYLKEMED